MNNNNNKKIVFGRILYGGKIGWNRPTLPDNILKFQLHPLIRILRVLGGISTVLILTKKSLLFSSFFSLYIFIINFNVLYLSYMYIYILS
jgi:hypothetical protein